MGLGKCKFCGQYKQMAKAHLLPRSVYPKLLSQEPYYLYSTETEKNIKSRIGSYDLNLLCVDCDREFGAFDQCAAEILKPWPSRTQLLREEDGFISRGQNSRYSGYSLTNLDEDRLQLFAASIVWRCHYTNRVEFKIPASDSLIEKCENLLKSHDQAFHLGVFGQRLDNRTFSQFVSRPVEFSGAHGSGIEFCFSGFILNILENKPDSISPVFLGNDDMWWIRFKPF